MTAKGYSSLILFFGVMAALALVLSLIFTNPASIGPIGVTVWFLIFLAGAACLSASLLFWLKQRSPRIQNTPERLFENSWRQGWLIGGSIIALLALSSLRQLTLKDAGIMAAIAVLLEIFLRSRK